MKMNKFNLIHPYIHVQVKVALEKLSFSFTSVTLMLYFFDIVVRANNKFK